MPAFSFQAVFIIAAAGCMVCLYIYVDYWFQNWQERRMREAYEALNANDQFLFYQRAILNGDPVYSWMEPEEDQVKHVVQTDEGGLMNILPGLSPTAYAITEPDNINKA